MNTRNRMGRISIRSSIILIPHLFLCAASLLYGQTALQSKDGYMRHQGDEWIIGTSKVEKRVRLADGQLSLTSLRNKASGREYQDSNTPPAEIEFFSNGKDVSASNWHWQLRAEHSFLADQGELQLDIQLKSEGVRVTKHYVIYPGTSVIREWLTLQNSSAIPIHISRVDFLHSRILGSSTQNLQFNYLTGGGNYNGSQLLKSEPMSPASQRVLAKYSGLVNSHRYSYCQSRS